MHAARKFQLTDRDEMAALVREIGFGSLIVQTPEGLRAVHVPVLIEGERLLFHVSRGNAVHASLTAGCNALFVANGPHAYLSPDDYGLPDRVPTWNYIAVELEGAVRPVPEAELVAMLDAVSAANEARLAPKPVWTRAAMSAGKFEGLVKAIGGFEMRIASWRGTAKIDQDKPAEVRARLAAALAGRGEAEMAQVIYPAAPGAEAG
jgi:transcriptional regulator